MKKKLLLTSVVVASIASVDAQISITSANMPVAGNMYINGGDTSVTSYGSSGANQTWNFAAWTNDEPDTTSFSAPMSLNGGSSFPTATLGTGDENVSVFLKVSSTQMEIQGYYADFGSGLMPIMFMPAQKFITFPSTYQTAFNSTSAYDVTIDPGQMGVDSMRIKSVTFTESTVDGWGTITTPALTGVASIRQFVTETRTDSTWGLLTGQTTWTLFNDNVDTSYTYRWWSNAHTFPVAEVSFDAGATTYNASYLSSTMVGVNEAAKPKTNITVYPSPAAEKVNFSGAAEGSLLVIFDQNGKMVEQTTLRKNNNIINTASYTNGLYYYNIISKNGAAVSKGKFAVTK